MFMKSFRLLLLYYAYFLNRIFFIIISKDKIIFKEVAFKGGLNIRKSRIIYLENIGD